MLVIGAMFVAMRQSSSSTSISTSTATPSPPMVSENTPLIQQ